MSLTCDIAMDVKEIHPRGSLLPSRGSALVWTCSNGLLPVATFLVSTTALSSPDPSWHF